MTKEEREEAIKYFEDMMPCVNRRIQSVFETAIEALKAEPCEDAVSRQAVLACEQHIWTDCGVVSVEDIKALPPVTPTPTECEDAVSREAAIATADFTDCPNVLVEICKQVTDEVVKRLKALPPVNPKQRTGKWIKVVTETDSFGNETYHHECSVCRCNKSGWGEYRFFPNCGAKMEEVSE